MNGTDSSNQQHDAAHSTEHLDSAQRDQESYGSSAFQHAAGQPQNARTAKKQSGVRTFFTAFAGALLACMMAFAAFALFMDEKNEDDSSTVLGASSTLVDAEDVDATLAEAVAAKCLPSVVSIDVYATASSYGYASDELVQSSLGSGVVLTQDGYIVTNDHVVSGADELMVTIEGEQYEADLIGSDPSSDIAVIKARDAQDLTPIELGDSDDLTIGEWVMSIGSPFGLEQSVATGIVSATSRSSIVGAETPQGEATIYPNMIQTDAAINPGNSGGALVDAEGRLVGINTLITSYSGNYSGVGFAIPANYAVSLSQQIIDGKTPSHAQLGVSVSTITSDIAQRYGLPVSEGAYITQIVEGSGAADAKLQEGDIIVSLDGEEVSSASDVMLAVRGRSEGDVVEVVVNRAGKELEFEVTLGSDTQTVAVSQSALPHVDRLAG